jgi:hypothetical protein
MPSSRSRNVCSRPRDRGASRSRSRRSGSPRHRLRSLKGERRRVFRSNTGTNAIGDTGTSVTSIEQLPRDLLQRIVNDSITYDNCADLVLEDRDQTGVSKIMLTCGYGFLFTESYTQKVGSSISKIYHTLNPRLILGDNVQQWNNRVFDEYDDYRISANMRHAPKGQPISDTWRYNMELFAHIIGTTICDESESYQVRPVTREPMTDTVSLRIVVWKRVANTLSVLKNVKRSVFDRFCLLMSSKTGRM